MDNLELNEMKIKETEEKLVSSIKKLRDKLNRELEQIKACESMKQEYRPNKLGVVQEKGQEIDNLCGRLGGLYEMRDILDENTIVF